MKNFFEKNKIPTAIIIAAFIIAGSVRLSNKPTPTMARNERERTPTPQQPPEPVQQPLIHIPYTEAPNNVGEYVCVAGGADLARTAKETTFLNFRSDYNTRPFGTAIFSPDAHKFPNPKQYEKETVETAGLTTTHQGRAQTIFNDPNQIEISKSAPAPQVPKPAEPVQPPTKRINYIEAPNHMGEYACVVGKVDHIYTSQKGNTYLNFCSGYITCPFGAVIFKSDAFKLPLPKRFEGKTVEITGLITAYRGQARIILNDSNQIKISRRERTAEPEQPPAKRINYTEAPNHVGEYACVMGKVDHIYTSQKGSTFLNFCPSHRTCSFVAVIFNPDAFKFPLPKRYKGKSVEITGLITTYRGRVQIILNDSSQIKYTSRSSL